MTVAVCLECGTLKTGAWSACPNCGFEPRGDEVLARALLVSDNCTARETLEVMDQRRREGEPWNFDPQLVEVVKGRLAALIPKNHEGRPAGMAPDYQQGQSVSSAPKNPWWRFWR